VVSPRLLLERVWNASESDLDLPAFLALVALEGCGRAACRAGLLGDDFAPVSPAVLAHAA